MERSVATATRLEPCGHHAFGQFRDVSARIKSGCVIPLKQNMHQQAAEKLSFVILDAASSAFTRVFDALWRLSGIHTPSRKDAEKQGLCTRLFDALWRLSGIHTPSRKDAEKQGLWIPGSGLRPAPE
jgi:hypothetical protein